MLVVIPPTNIGFSRANSNFSFLDWICCSKHMETRFHGDKHVPIADKGDIAIVPVPNLAAIIAKQEVRTFRILYRNNIFH